MEVPSCFFRSSTVVGCVTRNSVNNPFYIHISNGKLGSYSEIKGTLMHPIGCVAQDDININCFAIGSNMHLHDKHWSKSGWSDWHDIGGLVKGRPSVTTWNVPKSNKRRIDVFLWILVRTASCRRRGTEYCGSSGWIWAAPSPPVPNA